MGRLKSLFHGQIPRVMRYGNENIIDISVLSGVTAERRRDQRSASGAILHCSAFNESIQILRAGIDSFPHDAQLRLCVAISYMNVRDYRQALTLLSKLEHPKEGVYFIAQCYRALKSMRYKVFMKKPATSYQS
ncbi:MAG: hypothetical protein R3274_02795 [Desulfobacterales bacterium]|nr:hypothetical protein [Desulfobacterales bacterium]